MRFLGKNSKGELVELPIRVQRDPNYQEVYAHGAFGGALANYHFRIDFYKDISPPLSHVMLENKIVEESFTEVERRIMTSVYVPFPFLKELKNWLDKNIQMIEAEYGEIQLPKSKELEELKAAEPQVKEA